MKWWHSLMKFFLVWLLSMLFWSFCSGMDSRGIVLIWIHLSVNVLGIALMGAAISALLQWGLKKNWQYLDDFLFFIFIWVMYDSRLDGIDFVLLIGIHALMLIVFNVMYINRHRWDLKL